MNMYTVSYTVQNIEAETPDEAARLVLAIIQGREADAYFFDVCDEETRQETTVGCRGRARPQKPVSAPNRNIFRVYLEAEGFGVKHSYIVKASSVHVALSRASEHFERDTAAQVRLIALRERFITANVALIENDAAETYRETFKNGLAYRIE